MVKVGSYIVLLFYSLILEYSFVAYVLRFLPVDVSPLSFHDSICCIPMVNCACTGTQEVIRGTTLRIYMFALYFPCSRLSCLPTANPRRLYIYSPTTPDSYEVVVVIRGEKLEKTCGMGV